MKEVRDNKKKETARIYSQTQMAQGIYDMWIETPLAQGAKPGQFICVYPRNQSTLLPRPISVCEVNQEKDKLRIVYRIAGSGTAEFATYQQGEPIEILGILGNGFPIEKARKEQTALLVGGGIGIPPLLELAKCLQGHKKIIVGYRDVCFLQEDLAQYAEVYVATEDGSCGTKGTVMDVIDAHHLQGDLLYACGPMPMLRALKQFALANQTEAYLSLEERMACGIGACLGCVCNTTEKDKHFHVNKARICTEGPVYHASEVDI